MKQRITTMLKLKEQLLKIGFPVVVVIEMLKTASERPEKEWGIPECVKTRRK